MPSIIIRDLKRSTELDRGAMGDIRGGFAFGKNVNVNLDVNQNIFQVQQVGVNVLNNNGSIGAGFVGPIVDVEVLQQATNNAFQPKFV